MATYYLKTPLSEEDVTQLKLGDVVYITGDAFTCRSRLHRWVLDENHPLPVALLMARITQSPYVYFLPS